jgi:Pyruvate/2-oxoglutarate dehydrogenase complex, dehydrogenase (E1) component, eukaryotic type, beta subunit
VVAEACRSYGPANEWAMVAIERAWGHLRAPVVRVAGRDTPVPFANSIEAGVWPNADDVAAAVRTVMASGRSGGQPGHPGAVDGGSAAWP